MQKSLVLNIQRHEFDLAALRQEFEAEWKPEEPEVPENPEVPEDPQEPEVPEEPQEPEQPEDPENPEEPEAPETPEEPEQPEHPAKKQSREENSAFAEMRRQNEELQRQRAQEQAVLEQIASQYGMTVDEFKNAYAEQQLQKRAQEQNVTPEFLRRQEQSESRLQQLEAQAAQDRYLLEVERVKNQYGITDNEAKTVFEYIGQRGLYDPNLRVPVIPFEDAYKAANFDTLTERKVREAKQQDLAAKKQRQQRSAVAHNVSSAANQDTDEITDDFVTKRLKERGLL